MELVPLGAADRRQLSELMDEEERAWLEDLRWDYAPIRQVLSAHLERDLLPGCAAVSGTRLLGYNYFLVHGDRGMIGNLYARPGRAHEVADALLARVIGALESAPGIRRIEAQPAPLGSLSFTAVFTRCGFGHYARSFLELDLGAPGLDVPVAPGVIPWSPSHLHGVAEILLASYRGQTDAALCEDYTTVAGCVSHLESLVQNPGCDTFLPAASCIALDGRGVPCGFVIATRISPTAAMIPQISVHPEAQAGGLGSALIGRALAELRRAGYRTVSLTVTDQNRRALDWYRRLGFRLRKGWDAYAWERVTPHDGSASPISATSR